MGIALAFAASSLTAPQSSAADLLREPTLERAHVVVDGPSHRLEVRDRAAVAFTTLEALANGIERELPPGATAARVLRRARGEMVDYVLGVTENGRLLVGTQHRWLDPRIGHYVFIRGGMERAFSRLDEPGPWTWLVPMMVAPAIEITLRVSAPPRPWPVETLEITPLR